MAQLMTQDISIRIKELTGLTLTKFAKKHHLDYLLLKSFISGFCKGTQKHTKVKKVKDKLFALGIITKSDIEDQAKALKEQRTKFQKDKNERRKTIARIRKNFNQSGQEYFFERKQYFDEHSVSLDLFRSFVSGVGNGLKPGTKSYAIRKQLEADQLIPLFSPDEKKND